MTRGPLLPKIISFSFSLILTNVLQLLYNAADLIVVGQFSGSPNAVGAIGATNALTNLIVNLFIGLSVGVSVLVARGYGKSDRSYVERVVHTAITVALISGAVITAFGLIFSTTILGWMGTSEAIIGQSSLYLMIYFIGAPFNMVYNFGASILRATGDTKRPFYFLAVSGLANIVLNLIFVCLFHMDVAGVAIGTVASQVISAVLVVLCLLKQNGMCRLSFRKLRIDMGVMAEMIRIGLPASIQSCVFSISNILIQSSINSFDIAFVAEGRAPYATGSAAAASIEAFVLMSMSALYQASLNFTGQNSAAGQYKRVRKTLWQCLACVAVVGIVMGGICILFGKQLIAIYTPGDAEAIAVGYRRMQILCSLYFLCGIMDVTVGQLRGLGHSFVPMCVSIVGICVFRVFWIYTIFAAVHTWEMLLISYPITWVLTGAVQFICYYFIQKKFPKEDQPLPSPA
ncbi:MAG: MATE family efflux transporter [Clostridia bacterium]|nr:MATE family efflux transporter [Clostridia bacterium]